MTTSSAGIKLTAPPYNGLKFMASSSTTRATLLDAIKRRGKEADAAEVRATAAKQALRDAKQSLKKARKVSRTAKKVAKEARKKVDGARARVKRADALSSAQKNSSASGRMGRSAKSSRAPAPVAQTGAKRRRTASGSGRASAAEVAKSVIKRLTASQPNKGSSRESAGEGHPRSTEVSQEKAPADTAL